MLVLILVAGLVTGFMLTHRPLPQTTGELAVPGLASEVTVVRDEFGIPQLYGDSMDDLMRAQGFVHAQERFYEMDIRRHLTAGRLSEMFGETTLETDELIRTMGWRRVAGRGDGAGRARTRARHWRPTPTASTPTSPTVTRASWASSTPSCAPAGWTTDPSPGHRSTPSPGSRRWPGTCAAT